MSSPRFSRTYVAMVIAVAISMLCAVVALPEVASAAGPPYDGPVTQSTGPAYFGPAPNPFPYCENPTYFDPFPENVAPIGQIDVTGSPNASVTTDGITMTFELTNEGDTAGQYPGFFPANGDGGPGDQPKGIEMASSDAATILLSEPLFYTQWVFTDVDQDNEGFFVTPLWSGAPGQVAVFGGDANFDFTGTTTTQAVFNDTNQQGSASEAIEGRVQVDLLGAATGLDIARDVGSGQSGFAVGGGCEPIGVAKEVTSGPTWNGSSFDVTYTIRVRNNLPSTATIGADIAAAEAAAASSTSTGTPVGIDMTDVTLTDLLTDAAFSSVTVVSNTNTSGNVAVNDSFDGDADIQLLAAGETITPESEEEFVLELQYVPATDGVLGATCATTYQLLNQATAAGTADGVDVSDLSDDGDDPDPGANNGDGENDDPTVVVFDCPPPAPEASIAIVKTVLAGPAATCPDFAGGVAGDGAALDVTVGDSVTYCISVRNTGEVALDNVAIGDPQAPAGFGTVGALAIDGEATLSFDLVAAADTPVQNTATASGDDPDGVAVDQPTDNALINPVVPPVQPAISLSKTVLSGAGADCSTASEGTDEFVLGAPNDPIVWCFVVTNTGDVALTNVLFTDVPAGIAARDLLAQESLTTLPVGDTIEFSLAGTIPTAGLDNEASVTGQASNADGTPIIGIAAVDDVNQAEVASAAVTLAKTVAAGANADCAEASDLVTINAGELVTYCFEVSNTGGVDLLVTEVVDVTLGVTVPIPAASQTIAPGTSVLVTHVAPAIELVNTASIVALPLDPNGDPFPNPPTLEPQDPAEVNALEADLSIVKDNAPYATAAPGQTVPYTLDITNDGPDAAVDVVVVDTLPAGLTLRDMPMDDDWSCDSVAAVMTCTKATDLAAGNTVSLDYRVIVDASAADGVVLVNTASVTASTPDPDPTDNETTETITVNIPDPPPDEPLGIVTITNPPPSPVAPPAPPAPPLAVTGSVHSGWLIMAAAAMSATGGTFFVASRRSEEL